MACASPSRENMREKADSESLERLREALRREQGFYTDSQVRVLLRLAQIPYFIRGFGLQVWQLEHPGLMLNLILATVTLATAKARASRRKCELANLIQGCTTSPRPGSLLSLRFTS